MTNEIPDNLKPIYDAVISGTHVPLIWEHQGCPTDPYVGPITVDVVPNFTYIVPPSNE